MFTVARPNKLAPHWHGSGVIEKQLSETNYLVTLTDKGGRSKIFHVNMLKPYYRRPETINLLVEDYEGESSLEREIDFPGISSDSNIFDFEELTQDSNLEEMLEPNQIEQLRKLLTKYIHVFSNESGLTDLVVQAIELISDKQIRSKPYRTSARRTEIICQEIAKMLDMGITEIGESEFSSPLIVVEAPNKDPRICIDYRQVNEVIRTEFFPLPNIEERVEQVSAAKFITLFDLSKGYWQIPLSEEAKQIAAFVTSFGSYRPLRLPMGLQNSPYIFSKLMSQLFNGCEEFAVAYGSDMAVYLEEWEDHLKHIERVLQIISKAGLTIKPSKCKFAQKHVQYLGHIVANGIRKPTEIKIKAISDFPEPKN